MRSEERKWDTMKHSLAALHWYQLTQLEMNKPFLPDARQTFSPVTSCLCVCFTSPFQNVSCGLLSRQKCEMNAIALRITLPNLSGSECIEASETSCRYKAFQNTAFEQSFKVFSARSSFPHLTKLIILSWPLRLILTLWNWPDLEVWTSLLKCFTKH